MIIIHTCGKYEESRCSHILDTWAKESREDADIYFFTDNPLSSLPNTVYGGPYSPGYTYHPVSFIKILRLFQDRADHPWLLVIDDDSYLNISSLINYLSLFDYEKPYLVADFVNWPAFIPELLPDLASQLLGKELTPNDDYQLWPGGGPGLAFTRKAVDALMSLYSYYKMVDHPVLDPVNHDVWLHKLLMNAPTKVLDRIHCPGFHQYGNDQLVTEGHSAKRKIISVHLNHNIEQMHYFHQLVHGPQEGSKTAPKSAGKGA